MADKADLPASKVNMPANELIFLEHVTHDLGFRTALIDKNWDQVMKDLDRIGIQIEAKDRDKVRKAIEAIDWSKLRNLETLLNDRLEVRMG